MEQTPKPAEPAKPKSMKSMYAAVGAIVVIVIVVLALYFGGVFTPPNNTPGTPLNIYGDGSSYTSCSSYTNCGFDKSPITIAHGTKLTWTNNSTTTSHTVTECVSSSGATYCPTKDATPLSPSFDSGSSGINSGNTYSYTFQTAGTYYYYCQYHNTMHGEVIV